MRRFLAAAVALAPLCIVSAARADETIGNAIRGPVLTSTEGNLTINGSVAPGTLSPQPTGCAANQSPLSLTGAAGCPLVAVFLNGTGTTVTNNGTVGSGSLTKTGGATGILIQGGASGEIDNEASINLTDGYSPPTNSNTGETYGAWSNTTSPQNNYGIRLIAGPSGRGLHRRHLHGSRQLDLGFRQQFVRHLDRGPDRRRRLGDSSPPSGRTEARWGPGTSRSRPPARSR